MRVLIIEDETYNFESLKRKLLRLYPLADIEGPITNLVDLEQMLHYEQRFDVIYCDIRLEDGLCFTVLNANEIEVPIIFTTAYSEFALEAFDANGIAYLLKPIKDDALKKATEKALAMGSDSQRLANMLESIGLGEKQKVLHYLKANAYDGTYIVDTAEVNYFIATDKRAEACTTDGLKHRVNYTLEQLMQRLDPIQFFRANRQFIIARKAIHRIQNYGNRQLLVQIKNFDNIQILISKESVATFYDWIEQ